MKPARIFLFLFFALQATLAHACYCEEPTIEEALYNSDVVFLGEMVERADSINIFSTYGEGEYGRSYANFKILKTYKGTSEYTEWVTVFDDAFYNDCRGVFGRGKYGDTVLVFANLSDVALRFASTSHCRGVRWASEFGAEEYMFLEKEHSWIVPHPAVTLESNFHQLEKFCPDTIENKFIPWPLLFLLATSFGLNVFLLLKKRSG